MGEKEKIESEKSFDYLNNQNLFQNQKMEPIEVLASGIAHDFNNIITIINGALLALKNNQTSKEKMLKNIVIIESCTQRLKNTTDQLLNFSKKNQVHFSKISILEIISDLKNLLGYSFTPSIKIQVENNLSNSYIYGEEIKIYQALLNIIINAKDAILEKKDKGKIKITLKNVYLEDFNLESKNYICISIIDSGKGIPINQQNKIFDIFFTTKEIGKGTGLGLAISKEIIKKHDGFIEFKSIYGKGSSFIIYLPSCSEE